MRESLLEVIRLFLQMILLLQIIEHQVRCAHAVGSVPDGVIDAEDQVVLHHVQVCQSLFFVHSFSSFDAS